MSNEFGIIGGTGKQGTALAKRLVRNGYMVRIGSRSNERGKKHALELNDVLNTSSISGGDNSFALDADIIVLAIPFDQVDPLISPYANKLANKIVFDMTVNLQFGKYIKTKLHNQMSSYEYIREQFPDADVVACLKTISFVILDEEGPIEQTDFQITTSDEAYDFSSNLVKQFGLTPVRVRGKAHAHTIERMVALSIQLNKEYKGSHVGYLLKNVKF